ncbi:Pao retrotransposon peptidase superfamily [Trichinella spiralis]|uniref:Pao retrotransposon peptidase superfamily n=1 Tax=Trichinella spiralis TaxID=6334 RepID=UPI0001EFE57C|nr:Pao retrotransposon peptidase superfamily [Trichinella spiralis]
MGQQGRHNHLPSRLCSKTRPTDDKERNVERDYEDFRPNMLKDWRDWIAEIPLISEIRLPRCLLPAGTDCIKEVELHGYGDASEMAYGSAVYLRATTVSGETVVKLVMSKIRIAPVKRITLRRLELMAVLITARLISFVKFSKIICWTDSQTALRWIQGDSYMSHPELVKSIELTTTNSEARNESNIMQI